MARQVSIFWHTQIKGYMNVCYYLKHIKHFVLVSFQLKPIVLSLRLKDDYEMLKFFFINFNFFLFFSSKIRILSFSIYTFRLKKFFYRRH